jgi:DNA-binding IclR family transcriptional regulator
VAKALGAAARMLARQTRDDQHLVAVGHPHLARLCARLDETVNLVVLDGAEALFVDGIQSGQPLRVGTRTGARLPAYATAGGKVLLAQLPRARLRDFYPAELHRVTRYTLPDRESLDGELEQVRECGYALNLGEHLVEVRFKGVHLFISVRSTIGSALAVAVAMVGAAGTAYAAGPSGVRVAETAQGSALSAAPHKFRAKFRTLQDCQRQAQRDHPGRQGDWDCRQGPDKNSPWEYWGA